MNILFIFSEPIISSRGGVQRVTDILAKAFLEMGHSAYFLCYSKKELIDTYTFTAPQFYIDTTKGETHIKNELERIVNQSHIEYVINQLPEGSIIKYLPSNLKIITTCHFRPFYEEGVTRSRIFSKRSKNLRQVIYNFISFILPSFDVWFSNRFQIKGFQEAFLYSDKVCFISERFFPRILNKIPNLPLTKLCAINNPNSFIGVDNLDLSRKEDIVLYVGRIENSQKNTIGFIKAWRTIQKKNPRNWNAIVIGDGEDLAYNKKYVNDHCIPNISFIGRENNVSDYYKRAKFVAVPSYGESWCMVLTEAMTFGCVPIAFDTYETVRDIIDDQTNGIIVKPNYESLAESLYHYMNDEESRIRMASDAISKVKRFDVSIIISQWVTLLKSI